MVHGLAYLEHPLLHTHALPKWNLGLHKRKPSFPVAARVDLHEYAGFRGVVMSMLFECPVGGYVNLHSTLGRSLQAHYIHLCSGKYLSLRGKLFRTPNTHSPKHMPGSIPGGLVRFKASSLLDEHLATLFETSLCQKVSRDDAKAERRITIFSLHPLPS